MVVTRDLHIDTQGNCDVLDVTRQVAEAVTESSARNGTVTVFCPGATGAVTTVEYESGAVEDIRRILDETAPPDGNYHHHLRWGDDNGHSHVRAALVGPSLTVPFTDGRLALGTWQQIVFIDFDTRPRSRRLVVQVMGE